MNGPPDELSYSMLGLPGFHRTTVFWDGNRVHYSVTRSGREEAREFVPPTEEWETLWGVLERLRAWEWEEEYVDRGVRDGVQWSFSVSQGGKRVACHGANAFPPGFRVLQGMIDRLVEGSLCGNDVPEHPRSLLRAAETAGQVHNHPSVAVAALARTLKEAAWDERRLTEAVEGLGRLGRLAVPAIPDMLEVLGADYGVFLAYTGRDALSAIASDLERADPAERQRLAAPALPAILTVLRERKLSAEIRVPLVHVVRCAGLGHPGATEAILACLRDEDRWLFDSARYTLEAMAPRPPEAVPVLLDVLRERLVAKYGFSEGIIQALRLYGDEAAGLAAPILLEALDHAEADVRNRALEGLSALGSASKAVLPKLIAGLSSPDETTQWRSAELLGKIGPAAADAVPALLDLLGNGKYFVRWRAATALGKIGRPEAIPSLVAALTDQSPEVAKYAAHALEEFGSASAVAVEDLARLLRTGRGPGHWGASYVLGKLGPLAAPAVPALVVALAGDESQWDRLECATALGRIGPAAASAGPALVEALRDKSVNVRIGAAEALRQVGYEPTAGVPVLAEIVQGKYDTWDRESAAKALAAFGASAAAAAPALTTALGDPEERVRKAAEQALSAIGAVPTPSTPQEPAEDLSQPKHEEPVPLARRESPRPEAGQPPKKPWWKFW